jgi:hypothetical protein
MEVTEKAGRQSEHWTDVQITAQCGRGKRKWIGGRISAQSTRECIPTQSVGTINACSLKLVSTIQIDGAPTGLFPAKAGPTKKQRV